MHINVKTQLENNNITYEIIHHAAIGSIHSAYDFSRASGIPLSQIAKTLFIKSKQKEGYGMAILRSACRANLKAIARGLGFHSVEFASEAELEEVTGYKKYGTTAIGSNIPTVVHKDLLNEKYMYVATGDPGEELKISPHDLIKITQAKTEDIVEKV